MVFGGQRPAQIDFENVWLDLQPVVEEARLCEAVDRAEQEDDPTAQLLVRWLKAFRPEIDALETVRNATGELNDEALRAAERAAEEVLGAFRDASSELEGASSVVTVAENQQESGAELAPS